MPKLIVQNLTSLHDKKITLDNINYTFHPGKVYGLIGKSGAGKTTLANHLMGFQATVYGQLKMENLERGLGLKYPTNPIRSKLAKWFVKQSPLTKWRKHIRMVFQFPEYQLFKDSVKKDVLFGLLNDRLNRHQAEAIAEQNLRRLGIPTDKWTEHPFNLSEGQKRKVALVGILSLNSEILIFDEPLAGLDYSSRQETLQIIRDCQKTILFITHDYDAALEVCDEILVLDQGKIRISGKPYAVFSQLALQPQIIRFLQQLKQMNPIYEQVWQKEPRTINELALSLKELHHCP